MYISKFLAIFSLSVTVIDVVAKAQSNNFVIQKTFHVQGDGRWDYLAISPVKDYLYIAHGTQVNIINKTNGDSAGVIPNTLGVHGIAFAPAFSKGYTSNGKANTLTVFDINTNKVTGEIAVGENPDAVIYEPYSKKLIVCNGHSSDLSIVDPATNKVVKTIPLGGKPETPVSDKEGRLFINIEDKNEIVVINTQTFEIARRWHVGHGEEPSGLAMDLITKRLFAGCGNKLLIIMDATNGKIVKEIPIGEGSDGVAFDQQQQLIYSSNGSGTLTIIKEKTPSEFSLITELPTKKGARTIALDPSTHLVYLPTAVFAGADAGKKAALLPGTFEVLVIGNK